MLLLFYLSLSSLLLLLPSLLFNFERFPPLYTLLSEERLGLILNESEY